VTKVGFTVLVLKQGKIVAVEEPTITKSKKGAAGPEFLKENVCRLFHMNGIVHHEFLPPYTTINS
jgi:hypothetical protein